MKIVVAIKQVPDTATQVKVSGGESESTTVSGGFWLGAKAPARVTG